MKVKLNLGAGYKSLVTEGVGPGLKLGWST